MSRNLLLAAILALAFFGIADSWYLADAAFGETALTCGIEALDGCNTVAESEYSRLFGLPLALYGVAFYSILFILSAVLLALRDRFLEKVLYGGSLAAFLASLYFLYLQVFVIRALCVYCLVSFFLSSCIALAAWKLIRRSSTAVLP